MPSIRISYDEDALELNIERVVKRKLNHALSIDTKKEIAGEYAMRVAQYVPYKSGRLRNSAEVISDGDKAVIRYSARSRHGKHYDYAENQYSTPRDPDRRWTPGTYDHWNRHLTTAERQDFYQEAAEIIAREMNNG